MFQAAIHRPIVFKGFANATFDERIVALTQRDRRIAYYYDTPDTSTFRYRVLNMVHALDAWPEGGTSAAWFCRADLDQMDRFVDRADALVMCRALYTPALDRMVARAKRRGIPVIFDCDDLVFDPVYVPLVLKSLDLDLNREANLQDWYAWFARHGAVMRLCDRGIATNPPLAERMEASSGHIRAKVIPNFLHDVQQTFSVQIYEAKRKSRFRSDGAITIGYFSGSPSHNRDFAVSAHALERLMDEDARIRLRLVGFLDMKGRLTKHASRIEFCPLQDPINLQRLIAEIEINISPLQNNLFTNCKSELKYFEAAIAGTITVATPTYTFSRAIVDGENGFLAEAHKWEEKLQLARDVVDDPARYAAMAERAFNLTELNYGWNRYGAMIATTVFDPASATVSELVSISRCRSAPPSSVHRGSALPVLPAK